MKVISIILFALTGLFSFPGKTTSINAILISYNSQGSVDTLKKYNLNDSIKYKIVDLLFCIKQFDFPPNLPKDLSIINKGSFHVSSDQKKIYDERGRLTSCFYQGSLISGISPVGYNFYYESDSSFVIKNIVDDFDGDIYEFNYDEDGNIVRIDLKNTNKKILNALLIEVK